MFQRLIRFLDANGDTLYGNITESDDLKKIEGLSVSVLAGSIEKGFTSTNKRSVATKVRLMFFFFAHPCTLGSAKIHHQLLPPLPHVPIFVCIGLNYRHHAKEANVSRSQ